jgi:hypothetical protein
MCRCQRLCDCQQLAAGCAAVGIPVPVPGGGGGLGRACMKCGWCGQLLHVDDDTSARRTRGQRRWLCCCIRTGQCCCAASVTVGPCLLAGVLFGGDRQPQQASRHAQTLPDSSVLRHVTH